MDEVFSFFLFENYSMNLLLSHNHTVFGPELVCSSIGLYDAGSRRWIILCNPVESIEVWSNDFDHHRKFLDIGLKLIMKL
jgi:hypothetical protein